MAERRGGGETVTLVSHSRVMVNALDGLPETFGNEGILSSTTTNQQSQKVAVRRDTETNCLRTGSDDTSSPLVQ
jgi:hypothetical protein